MPETVLSYFTSRQYVAKRYKRSPWGGGSSWVQLGPSTPEIQFLKCFPITLLLTLLWPCIMHSQDIAESMMLIFWEFDWIKDGWIHTLTRTITNDLLWVFDSKYSLTSVMRFRLDMSVQEEDFRSWPPLVSLHCTLGVRCAQLRQELLSPHCKERRTWMCTCIWVRAHVYLYVYVYVYVYVHVYLPTIMDCNVRSPQN